MKRKLIGIRQLLAAGVLLVLAATVWVVPLPQIVALRWRSPRTTAFMEARKARLRAQGRSDALDRRPVPLSAVSPALVAAVIAAEDARYWQHRGVDWQAVREASEWNRRIVGQKGRWKRGASTITQQLAKNLWLSGERTWWRKGREAAIALALDALVPKEKILEHYLSAIEWGERVWGIEAAARTTFGVPASALDERQASWLAAMIPNPSWYLARPERHRQRAALIAQRAFGAGKPVGEDESEEAPESPR
ncbi:MAG TPA: monofunctional biosynthetic peptidoglycan transglycosylase [Thermoanaerobaculia bacterium]|nr:monofunctional biosynthetic peptidoglycan transglycosylase [Thermoanaerobaculia bacterium]